MKVLLLVLALSIALCNTEVGDKTQAKVEPTPQPAIVTNAEKQKGTDASHVAVEAAKKENVKPAEAPATVKAQAKVETKQSTFTFGEINHQQTNFQKQVQTIKTNPVQWQSNPQAALQTQHQAQIEEEKENQEKEEENSLLKPWIVDQIRNFDKQIEGIITQSFHFILDPQQKYMFRWNPPKNQVLRLTVMVFQVMENGEIMLEQDLEENQYLEVQSKDEGRSSYMPLGKVYVSKVFKIDFDTDYKYFRFVSSIPQSVFVVVDLERLQEVIPSNVAKDQHFLLPLTKLKAIEEEVISGEKMREHTYKYEWGFLDNQYAHDSRLLGFTGFQLIVIIGSALTQLYFIKNLLDNRAIV